MKDFFPKRAISILLVIGMLVVGVITFIQIVQSRKSDTPALEDKYDKANRDAFLKECMEMANGSNLDSLKVKVYCECSVDSMLNRYTSEELEEYAKLAPEKQMEIYKDIIEHCTGKAGLDK